MLTVTVSDLPAFAPLDAQRDADDKVTVPSALAQRWSDARRLHVLVDGAKIANLAEMLEAAEVPHACLFDGDLDAYAGAAPWLVAVPQDHRLMRAIFTTEGAPQLALWPHAATMFIEGDVPLAGLRAHFRRFLRVTDAAEKMHFFRFWEASTSPAYFAAIADSPDLITRWFCPREGGRITALLVPDVAAATLHVVTPAGLPDVPPPPAGPFVLRDRDHAAMAQARLGCDLAAIAALLCTTFPETAGAMPASGLDGFTRRTVSRMHGYGFFQQDHLFSLLAWELHFGPFFENRDPDGILRQICEEPQPEGEKFALVSDRVATFE
jgi:catechol 2,3-dioxygenase-like lactoylglutathione lyase family enzyme